MKISVIVTVFNEAETIWPLLYGLTAQNYPADEVIVVDANSNDDTLQLIEFFRELHPGFPLKFFVKKGNRSVGRNYAIQQAQHEWLAMTDAGCIPDKKWLQELVQTAQKTSAAVVAGYYQGAPANVFQAAVVPYMLVMPDRVDKNNFLPATRSMLMKKSVWQDAGGFDENLALSEDYDFAQRLAAAKYKRAFAPQAKVAWLPLKTWNQFYRTVVGMAQSDALAGVTRIKSYLVLARYSIFLMLIIVFFSCHWLLGIAFIIFNALLYALWAVWKNAQYLDKDWGYLALLQIIADLGVMIGTVKGKFKLYLKKRSC